jgi:nickel/cobalt transporter (NicO) family protein
MNPELAILLGSAATLGVTHTAIGLDHTIPFIVLGRAREWSLSKALLVTAACGVAHVASSVAVGALGMTLAVTLTALEGFQEARGYWVSWALVAFGTLYAIVSLARLKRKTSHRHIHVHADGNIHRHPHGHGDMSSEAPRQHHAHVAKDESVHTLVGTLNKPMRGKVVAGLFIVFLLGPCEALLPLMTAPALRQDAAAGLLVAGVFGAATLTTMVGLVTAGWFGMRGDCLTRFEPHLNWASGVAIAMSGLCVQFLGL